MSNTQPVITSGTQSAAFTEIADGVSGENATLHSDGGTITFEDIDLTDRPTAALNGQTVTYRDAGGIVHALPLAGTSIDTFKGAFDIEVVVGNTNNGGYTWTYEIGDSALDFLGKNETVTIVSTVKVDDGQGGSASQDVTVTLIGTDDKPVITSSTQTASFTEIADGVSGENTTLHSDGGTITFEDVDLSDHPTASLDGQTVTYRDAGGTLHALPLAGTSIDTFKDAFDFDPVLGNANNGGYTWTYEIGDSALDFLGKNETVTIVSTVKVDDANGGSASQNVTVTLTGTNDKPVITSSTQSAAFTEIADGVSGENTALHSDGDTITFTDVDLSDRPAASLNGQTVTYRDAGGMLHALPLAGTGIDTFKGAFGFGPALGNANNGGYDWTYAIADSALDFLGKNETVTIVSTVKVDDANGGSASQDVTVTLTGTNDAPTILGLPVTVGPILTLTETADRTGVATPALSASGSLDFTDVDLSDVHTASDVKISQVWAQAGSKSIPTATVDALADADAFKAQISNDTAGDGTGTIGWTFGLADNFVDFLAVGETMNVAYDITVDDGNGGTSTKRVTLVLTGANDIPDATVDVVNTAEDATSVIIAKVIDGNVLSNDKDADLNDTLTVSAVAKGEFGSLNAGNVGIDLAGKFGVLHLQANGYYTYSFFNTDDAITTETITDIFHYQVSDGHGGLDDSTLTINIAGTDLNLTITPGPTGVHDVDPFIAQRGHDIVRGTAGVETIYGRGGNDTLYGYGGNDALYGETGNDRLWGGDNNDTLVGAEGNDVARGENGDDTIIGGTGVGYDIYDGGNDTDFLDYSSTTLGIRVDLTPIDRSAQPIAGLGAPATIGALLFAGGYSASQWVGYAVGAEIDTDAILNIENVTGGSGNDSITGDIAANLFHGGLGNDVLHGAGGADTLYGDDGRDYVEGGAANDTIFGGITTVASYDVYDGGADVDTVDYSTTTLGVNVNLTTANRQAEAVLNPDGAVGPEPDTIGALLASFALSPTLSVGRADGTDIATDVLVGIENVIGGSGNDTFVGDAAANTFTGGGGSDQIWSRGGNDTIYGGDGNDTLVGGFGGTGTPPPSGDDLIYGDAGNDQLFGEDGNDTLWGGAGVDQYAAGAGNDILYFEGDGNVDTAWGGTESDIFVFQQGFGNDIIKDYAAAGFNGDRIDLSAFTNVTFSSLTIRQVVTNGQSNVVITGLGTGNSITLEVVNAGAITPDDFIFYTNPNTPLTVNGTSATNYLVGGAVNDTINGLGGDDYLSGLGGNDSLNGGDGNDWLVGGAGNDNMVGGTGNDTYIVDSAGDNITEGSNAGTDVVQTTVTYTLPDNVENLTFLASGNINGTGNTAANTITGNAGDNSLFGLGGNDTLNGGDGNDLLDGGTGNDSLNGAAGDDTYVVDSTSDTITDASGTDTVQSSVTYTLGAAVENLVLTGSSNINGTGNATANVISGNGGNNVLNGAGGVDTLSYANAGGAVTVSLALAAAQATGGAGSDTISNFENLTGSNFGDTLTGNTGANVLKGGAGLDTLTGGAGADSFAFDSAALGLDTITDFASGSDKLQVSTSGFAGGLAAGGAATLYTQADIAGFDSGSANGYFFFDNGGPGRGTIYWDPTGGLSNDAVAFANIGATASLTAADFLLI